MDWDTTEVIGVGTSKMTGLTRQFLLFEYEVVNAQFGEMVCAATSRKFSPNDDYREFPYTRIPSLAAMPADILACTRAPE